MRLQSAKLGAGYLGAQLAGGIFGAAAAFSSLPSTLLHSRALSSEMLDDQTKLMHRMQIALEPLANAWAAHCRRSCLRMGLESQNATLACVARQQSLKCQGYVKALEKGLRCSKGVAPCR